jgi:anhydro-N-acetylmuramic acid kinase
MSALLTYKAIGLMSGTSLDGLDIVYCSLNFNERWTFEIHRARTISYDDAWKEKLRSAHTMSGAELTRLHTDLGILHGHWVKDFMDAQHVMVDFIASHGHTVFHQPENGMTLQIGSPAHIVAQTGVEVIADFRSTDVALGGQGAPLVPVGDVHLFSDYAACLNLGGIANVTVKNGSELSAFDITVCNMALNYYAERLGLMYDRNGDVARSGVVHAELLQALNALSFFYQSPPKSLGKEFWLSECLPVLEGVSLSESDSLRTFTEHIAIQIGQSLSGYNPDEVLVTGGGAHNQFLIERIAAHTQHRVVVPDNLIVDYKEALIFAFLGALRKSGHPNALRAITGASRDSLSGAVYSAR